MDRGDAFASETPQQRQQQSHRDPVVGHGGSLLNERRSRERVESARNGRSKQKGAINSVEEGRKADVAWFSQLKRAN
jgi:hypothetical protein